MNPIRDYTARSAPHPLCLFCGAVVFLACLVLVRRIEGLALMVGLWMVVMLSLRLRFAAVARGVFRLWPFLLLTGLFHAFLSGRESVELLGFFRIHVDFQSIASAAFFVGRLALILSVTIALFQLHPPQGYGSAVGRAFGRIKTGRSTLAQADLVISLTLRFIPFLEQEFRRIKLALSARGLNQSHGLIGRLRMLRTGLFALLINAFRRAEHVTLALEARGYDPQIVRTYWHVHPVKPAHIAITAVFIALCAAAPWV